MSFRSYGFPTRKAAGEWVETVFAMKAGALGLAISKPLGDSQPYDFVVQSRHLSPARVQVKSAFAKQHEDYIVCMRRHGAAYDPTEVDFFVAYIPPEDAWYVLPVADVRAPAICLRPHRPGGRYEKYRDAWRLITGDPEDDSRSLGFTIHASRADHI